MKRPYINLDVMLVLVLSLAQLAACHNLAPDVESDNGACHNKDNAEDENHSGGQHWVSMVYGVSWRSFAAGALEMACSLSALLTCFLPIAFVEWV